MMKNKMRKIVAVLLSLVVLCGFTVPAFAAENSLSVWGSNFQQFSPVQNDNDTYTMYVHLSSWHQNPDSSISIRLTSQTYQVFQVRLYDPSNNFLGSGIVATDGTDVDLYYYYYSPPVGDYKMVMIRQGSPRVTFQAYGRIYSD